MVLMILITVNHRTVFRRFWLSYLASAWYSVDINADDLMLELWYTNPITFMCTTEKALNEVIAGVLHTHLPKISRNDKQMDKLMI